MSQISQNILVQKLIDYKMRKNNKNKQRGSPQYSPPKMPISQRQSASSGHALSVHMRLKQLQIQDLIDLLSQMFRIVQQYEMQASHLWQKNSEMLQLVRVPLLEENLKLQHKLEDLKQNETQNSLFGQLKEYSQEKPKRKLIDLDNIKKHQNFQEEFMSKVNEFSLSWREEVLQLKQL